MHKTKKTTPNMTNKMCSKYYSLFISWGTSDTTTNVDRMNDEEWIVNKKFKYMKRRGWCVSCLEEIVELFVHKTKKIEERLGMKEKEMVQRYDERQDQPSLDSVPHFGNPKG